MSHKESKYKWCSSLFFSQISNWIVMTGNIVEIYDNNVIILNSTIEYTILISSIQMNSLTMYN